MELADWHNGRPRLDKDFNLRRINRPTEQGLVVDCSQAWDILAEHAPELATNYIEGNITASNLILGTVHITIICASVLIRGQLFISNNSPDMRHSG